MISRCPSCGGQVDDEADRCPSCHWDFNERRRIPPEGAAPVEEKTPPAPPKNQGAPPKKSEPPPGLAGLKMVAFSESLTETKTRVGDDAGGDKKEPPIKKEAPATGSGLLQFPKLDAASRKKDDDNDPFAVPAGPKLKTFGKEPVEPVKPAEAQPPKLPEAKPAAKLPEAKLPQAKAPEPKPPEAKLPEPKLPEGKLPELRPEDRRPGDPVKPAPKEERRPNPDFLKDLPRERPAEPRAQPKEPESVKAPPQAKAPVAPKAPEKGVVSSSEAEPPKTVIRVSRPAAEAPAFKAESKPPRKIERPAEKPAPAEPAEASSKKAASPLIWAGAAVGLVALGAGGALVLTPRHGSGVSAKPQADAGSVFAARPGAAPSPAPATAAPPAETAAPSPADTEPEPPEAAAPAPQASAPPPAAAAPVPAPAAAAAPAPTPAPAPAPAPAGTAADRAGTVVILKTPTLPPELLAKAKAKAAQWVFEGRVYDLIALNNVSGATLTLVGPDGKAAGETTTAPDGHYKLSVDALPSGGYTMEMAHPDYTGRFLDEINPPFDQAPRAVRLLAAKGTRSKPFVGETGHPVKRVLVAVPNNTDE